MKNIWVKRIAILLGSLLLLVIIANFGVNFWLKYKLPDYLKKNTNYIVTYKNLDVDLGTGNIFATGLTINNKQPNNTKIIRLQGTIDTLRINRVGFVNYLFNKEISTDYILLSNPSLKVLLAEPKDKVINKEKIPLDSEHIVIRNGNITILKHNQERFFSAKNLFVDVEGLAIDHKDNDQSLPMGFDRYQIKGDDLFVKLGDYGLSIVKMNTTENLTNIKGFHFQPMVSHANFQKKNPNQLNIFDVKIAEVSLKEILLQKKKLSLSNALFNGADITIFKTNAQIKEKKQTSVKMAFDIKEVVSKNARLKIVNSNQEETLNTGEFNVAVHQIIYDKETAKSPIPFLYDKFNVQGKQAYLNTKKQTFNILGYALNDVSGDFRNISVKSIHQNASSVNEGLMIDRIHYVLNDWKFIEKKLKLDVKNILVEGANGKLALNKNVNQKKSKNSFEGLFFPLLIKNVELKNSNVTLDQNQQPLVLQQLNARFANIEMNQETSKKDIPFKTGDYQIQSKNLDYTTKFYRISVGDVHLDKKEMSLKKVQLKPLYSRSQFVKMIPKEKDLYTLYANEIGMKGNWNLLSSDPFVDATNLKIDGLKANIFRSKIPLDDNSVKPLYATQLRKIKIPFYIANTNILNSVLEYEEDTPTSDGPGKLIFTNFNLNAKNINSGKFKGKPTQIPIKVQCKFLNISPMNVDWIIDTSKANDDFSISGNFNGLPASHVNMFVEPYLKIRTAGLIQQLKFNFKGNNQGIGGTMNMKHKDFKVSILRQDGEKNKVLSSVANIFVKSNSDQYPENVVIKGVKRDPVKSFFNLFWKGVEEGLALSFTGKSIVRTKATVSDVKDKTRDVTSAVKDVSKAVGETVQNVKITGDKNDKKESKLKNFFRKKEKAED